MAMKPAYTKARLARAKTAKATKLKTTALAKFAVCTNAGMRTCIQLLGHRERGQEFFIPLDMAGLEVKHLEAAAFAKEWRALPDYPVAKAARLFVGHATMVGASADVLKYLGEIVPIPAELLKSATARAEARLENLTKARAARAPKAKSRHRK
jgi:hypothetical protein